MKQTTLKKIHKVLMWLLALAMVGAICRTTQYYIDNYTDNSVNTYSVISSTPNNPK